MLKSTTLSIIVGIDASNLRSGGGVTHLIELLREAKPENHGISRVIVWGGQKTLNLLDDRKWLVKINPPALNSGLMKRTFWQSFKLSESAKKSKCDVVFVPGGAYAGSFRPFVTMSRNMLPFEWEELRRYGFSLTFFRYLVLRWVQSRTFCLAEGLVFLTNYAKDTISLLHNNIKSKKIVIPHGINKRFQLQSKRQLPISEYSYSRPYKLLYVSIVNLYKHQWHVLEAVSYLRREGLPVFLDLVGPAHPSSLFRLREMLAQLDPYEKWVSYHGAIPYTELHKMYRQADLGIFASSCENMPNILLENMAAALPVACSNRGPMPEILGDGGIYFDPEQPEDIAKALRNLIYSPDLRTRKIQISSAKAMQYSWKRCSHDTFAFLSKVARQL